MDICLNCFKKKGNFEVCPACGFVEGTSPAQMSHLSPGTELAGRYIVGTVIDFGGFGVIYRAWDTHLSKLMAIKEFFPSGFVTRSAQAREVTVFEKAHESGAFDAALTRFIAEARTLAAFHESPYIVNVFNYFEENKTAYFVMEFLEGISLSEYLAHLPQGKLDPDEALEVIEPVMEGLAAIHASGVIHRDIHPGNIFITTAKQIKIIDFGAARLSTGETESTLTVVATQGYTAPEQYRNKSKQGPFTDIYGLAATLYRMLTGVVPEESPDRQVNDTLASPLALNVLISKNADNAVMRAMAVNPELRFHKVSDFKQALIEGKKADDPKTVLRKRMTRRAFIIGGSLFLAAGGTGLGFFLKEKHENERTLQNTPLENDSMTLWLPVFGEEDEWAAQETLWRGLSEEFSTELSANAANANPTISIDIQPKPVASYAQDLAQAAEAEELPTIFFTDYSADDILTHAQPLDMLLKTIQTDEYLFFSRYEELFPAHDRVPLGFDLLTAYGNEIAAGEIGGVGQTSEGGDEGSGQEEPSVSESDAEADAESDAEADDSESNTEGVLPVSIPSLQMLYLHEASVSIQEAAYPSFLGLYFAELSDAEGLSEQDRESLEEGLAMIAEADPQNTEALPLDLMKENKLLYLVTFVSDHPDIAREAAGRYRVIPLTNEAISAGVFRRCCAVSAQASENQQNAAMLLLIYLVRNYSQNLLHVQNTAALPINKKAFTDYWISKPELVFLEDLEEREAEVSFFDFDKPELTRFGEEFFEGTIAADAVAGNAETTTAETAEPEADTPTTVYHNERFGYSLSLFGDYVAEREADNGDGRSFYDSTTEMRITASGMNNALNETCRQAYERELEGLGFDPGYTTCTDDMYVVSYEENGSVIYRRVYFGAGSSNTVAMRYPASQKAVCDPICAQIADAFVPGDISKGG